MQKKQKRLNLHKPAFKFGSFIYLVLTGNIAHAFHLPMSLEK